MKKISDNCSGCGLCEYICSKNAVRLIENRLGATEAQIDENMCISCGACMRMCPEKVAPMKIYPMSCYAAWAKRTDVYESTTSGGIATLLSESILKNNGVVYGAAFGVKRVVEHRRIDSIDDLDLIKGSKYVQSSLKGIFQQVKSDLLLEKNVLFLGTPCQCAAIRKCFPKNERLITVDLICHGTPPQKYFTEYLECFDIPDSDKVTVSFRNKNYWLQIFQNGKNIYSSRYNTDPYFYGFMFNILLRENCYSCQYSNVHRCSDITLGDFWGIEKLDNSLHKRPDFVSCVLINTKSGQDLFEKIKDQCYYEIHSIEDAVMGNSSLRMAAVRPPEKNKFNFSYEKDNLINAMKDAGIYKCVKKNKIRNFVLEPYRILKYGTDYKKKW